MLAIQTKYNDGHITITQETLRMRVSWDHSLDAEDNHIAAAQSMIAKHFPKRKLIATGYCRPGHYSHII